MISFQSPAKNTEDIAKSFPHGGNIEIDGISRPLQQNHLTNIKANVNGFAFSAKTQLMLSLMGVKFFFN